ncbi:MAG: protein-disulfide reductase DsbD N-terminal domain-containing protein, partial [Gallionellaceae bacterium]|nr:protein-disulfide reductase DsbD N-terminal domain-containing protein [Gallionellaceae bacterium]
MIHRLLSLLLLLSLAPLAQADLLSFGSKKSSFLPADQAFGLEVHAVGQNKLIASFRITPGYYLYRDKTSFSIANGQEGTTTVSLPRGEEKDDPNFGMIEVYHQSFQAEIALEKVDATKPLELNASYQGCSDKGLCYPPIEKTLTVNLAQTMETPESSPSVAPADN